MTKIRDFSGRICNGSCRPRWNLPWNFRLVEKRKKVIRIFELTQMTCRDIFL